MAELLFVGTRLHALYLDGEYYSAIVTCVSDSCRRTAAPVRVRYLGTASDDEEKWLPLDHLRSKVFAAQRTKQTPSTVQLKAALKAMPTVDYSVLKVGTRVQAEGGDGVYYAAEVLAVATSKRMANAPVKVNFCGYTNASDEWIGLDRLKSKALKPWRTEKAVVEEDAAVDCKEALVRHMDVTDAMCSAVCESDVASTAEPFEKQTTPGDESNEETTPRDASNEQTTPCDASTRQSTPRNGTDEGVQRPVTERAKTCNFAAQEVADRMVRPRSWDFPLTCLEARMRLAFAVEPWEALSGEDIWERSLAVLKKHRSQQILTIFDWDDTLLPNTALKVTGHIPGALADGATVDSVGPWPDAVRCARAAIRAIRAAKCLGRVAIVTNAGRGWVQKTAATFLPGVEQELEDVAIFSAQSIYRPQGFKDPVSWKVLTFQRILRAYGHVNTLITVGDAWIEREAALQAARVSREPIWVKSIKFTEQPSAPEVAAQLDNFVSCSAWMSQPGPLDTMMVGRHTPCEELMDDESREEIQNRVDYEVCMESK